MRARFAYSIALCILLLAIFVALMSGHWHWVSRSGSLIVVLGVLLTSSQIFANIDRLRQRRGEIGASANHDWSSEDDMRQLVKSIQRDEINWESERSGLVLLILGTLVWGFGDLPGLLG